MIVIKYKRLEKDIFITEDSFTNLIITNQLYFRTFLINLKEQLESDTEFLLTYENDKEITLGKKAILIENILAPEVDEKKLATYIQKDVSNHLTDTNKDKFQKLVNQINEYIKEISYDYEIPLIFDNNISPLPFFKSISLTGYQDKDSFLSYLVAEVRKQAFLNKKYLFFFINLHDYLNDEELNNFFYEMKKLEISFLIISGHLPSTISPYENIITLDEDLFDYYIAAALKKE